MTQTLLEHGDQPLLVSHTTFVSMFVSVTVTSDTSGVGKHCDQLRLVSPPMFVSVTNLTNFTFHISSLEQLPRLSLALGRIPEESVV